MTKKKAPKFNNDWQSLAAKPQKFTQKKDDKIEEPYKVRREDAYVSMFPSDEGEKYSFCIVPDKDGNPFVMTDVMTIKRFKFRNPKTNEDYFENLKLPMDPEMIFDMSVVDKKVKDPSSLTEEDKKVLKDIAKHADLVKRWKELYYCKVDNVNFGYAKSPTRYNGRLRKDALTGFFGIPTKWKGEEVPKKGVKFIQNRHLGFQDKFRALLKQTADTHDELQPTWYEDYFSNIGGYKGVIDVELGSMRVGGKGATVKLIKIGKDNIEDKGAGVLGGINDKDVTFPKGESNELSHLHYYMGFDSTQDIWQDLYAARFEEAIEDLENHVNDVVAKNNSTVSETEDAKKAEQILTQDGGQDDLPF